MFCNNCGARVDENARFCGQCGSKIVIPDVSETTEALINSPHICRNCGAELDPNGLFCGECGTPVSSLENNPDVIPNYQSTYQENIQYVNQQSAVQPLNQVSVVQPIDQSYSVQPLNQGYEPFEEQIPVQETYKGKENLTPLIVALAAVLVVCSCIILFVIKWSSKPISIDIPVNQETLSDEELNKSDIAVDDEEGESNHKSEVDSSPASVENDPAVVYDTGGAAPADTSSEPIAEPDYLFPSDRELITEEYLMTLTKEEVALVRNEIFARHGYIFQSEPFKTYFSNKPWYAPNENFSNDLLSEIEKTNAETIIAYEEKMGWR